MESVESLFVLSRHAYLAMERVYDEALALDGLPALDFEIVTAIHRGAGESIATLARATGWERSALSRRIRHLEAAGVVVTDRRKRRSRMTLTPTGLLLLGWGTRTCERLEKQWASDLAEDAIRVALILRRVAALRQRPAENSSELGEGTT